MNYCDSIQTIVIQFELLWFDSNLKSHNQIQKFYLINYSIIILMRPGVNDL